MHYQRVNDTHRNLGPDKASVCPHFQRQRHSESVLSPSQDLSLLQYDYLQKLLDTHNCVYQA